MPKLIRLTDQEYHALENVWGHSQLEDLRRSPLLFYHRHVAHTLPPAETDALHFGTAVHVAVLEPDRFDQVVATIPTDVLTSNGAKRGKKWEAWRDDHPGMIHLHQADVQQIFQLRKTLRRNEALKAFVDAPGQVEATVTWRDELTGLNRKAKFDKLARFGKRAVIVDLKTSIDPYPEGFRKQTVQFGYHRKAATYCDGAEALGLQVAGFIFIAAPKQAGFDPIVYQVAASAIDVGRDENRALLNELARRLQTDDWHHPQFDTIHELELPPWKYPPVTVVVKGRTVTV